MLRTKPTQCKHCNLVNVHFSFQCPTQRKPISKAKEPIKKVSDKRKKELSQYSKLCTGFKILNPICQGKLEGCTGKTQDVHHAAGKVGAALNNVENFIALCRSCHRIVEQSPLMAKELGLSKSRLGNNVKK